MHSSIHLEFVVVRNIILLKINLDNISFQDFRSIQLQFLVFVIYNTTKKKNLRYISFQDFVGTTAQSRSGPHIDSSILRPLTK